MQTTKRVLIGSCGGLTGIYLAKEIARRYESSIIGIDCSPISAGKLFVDTFIVAPKAADSSYLDFLIATLLDYEIEYFIPTHSEEIRVISQHEDYIKENAQNVKFIVSPFETFEALEDKESMTKNLFSSGIPCAGLIEEKNNQELHFPLFMKRRIGSGSTGSGLVNSLAEYEAIKDADNSVIFFDYISGNEFTIDCVFDSEGLLLAYNQRKRLKTLGGCAVISENDYSIDFKPWLKVFERNWVFKGCVNFQCIVQDGTPYFTDINLRFPSGGLPLTVESGVDVPEMLFKILDGEPISYGDYESDRQNRVMYRYFEEAFEVIA